MTAVACGQRLLDADFLHDPYPAYSELRAAGPIHWSDEFHGGAWLLTRHADVEAALRDPRLSAQRTGGWVMDASSGERSDLRPFQRLFARALLFLDQPDHQRLRQLMLPAFRPQRLAELRPVIESMVDELLDSFVRGECIDFMARIARPLPTRVIGSLMGLDTEREAEFMAWSDELASFIGAPQPTPEQARSAQRCLLQMADYFERELLPRRLREPRDDLVSLLAQAQVDGWIESGAELLAQCSMLLFAGYETTRNLLGNGMLTLLSEPAQWQRLCADPALAAGAVRELLRYDSPVQWTGRRVAVEHVRHGQELKRGDLLLCLIGSANRDPARHEQPDQLDIGRANPGALSFGSGPHVCIGAALTQLEGQLLWGALATRHPGIELAGDPQRNGNPVYRGVKTLPLRWA
jgi:cytochrome P450